MRLLTCTAMEWTAFVRLLSSGTEFETGHKKTWAKNQRNLLSFSSFYFILENPKCFLLACLEML